MGGLSQSVAVLTPFRSADPMRIRNRDWTRAWWETHFPDWRLIESSDGRKGAFSKTQAVNAAAQQAEGIDVLVVADADMIPNPTAVREAVGLAANYPWVVPQWDLVYLSAEATERVTREMPGWPLADRCREGYALNPEPCAGVFVLRRSIFNKVGGMDERFVGYGGEDFAFGLALSTLAGRYIRLPSSMYHLHHRRRRPLNETGVNFSTATQELARRYARAYGNLTAMQEVRRDIAPSCPATDGPTALALAVERLRDALADLETRPPSEVASEIFDLPLSIERECGPVYPALWGALLFYVRAIEDGFLTSAGLGPPGCPTRVPLSKLRVQLPSDTGDAVEVLSPRYHTGLAAFAVLAASTERTS